MAPDTLVANLYRQERQVFQQARSRVLLDKYFDKSLADLTWKELLYWESSGSEEDFDYVLYNFGYDEGTTTKLVISKPSYQGRKAQVNVSYDVVYAPPAVPKRSVDKETIIFLLAAGETGWRITDIKYDCQFDWCLHGVKTSLFEMYSMDSNATVAEREYWHAIPCCNNAQGYKDYLQSYPNGAYAGVARAKIRQIETVESGGNQPFKGTGELPIKKSDSAGMLAQGPAMLFKGTTSKLSNQDKQLIFEKLEFSLSRNKKFIVVRDLEDCGDASPSVEIVDLNGDRVEEVFVQWGNLCLAGNTGSNSAVFVKNGSGQFVEVLNVLGAAGVVGTRNKGFPDIKISGPGFCFNVMQWNGTKYEYKCSHEETPGGCTQKGVTTICK